MRDVAMYMSACFMIAGLIGLALLVLEFAVRRVQDYYAKVDPIPVVKRPASRGRHYGWGADPTENPYAEYAIKSNPKGWNR